MSQKYVYNPLTCEYDIINEGAPGVPGPRGPVGPPGPNGVGVPTGGTTGEVLAKASDDDFDTEWVAGGGGGDLQSVLNAGNHAEDSTITMDTSNNNKEMYLGAFGMQFMDNDGISIGMHTDSNSGLTISSQLMHGTDSGQHGIDIYGLWTDNKDTNRSARYKADKIELMTGLAGLGTVVGTYLIPNTMQVSGVETLASQEWVAANGGGTLDQVLAAGDSAADKQIHMVDNTGQQWVNIQSNVVQVRDSGGDVTVNPGSLAMGTSGGAYGSIALDPMMTMTGSLLIPETPGAEIIATRDWVAANYLSGTPDLDAVLDQGSTANNKNIMLNSSSGMTAIQPGGVAVANNAMDQIVSMDSSYLTFTNTPTDEYLSLGAGQLDFTSYVNGDMSILKAGSLVLSPGTNDSNTVITSSEVLVGDGADEHISIGTYPEAELRMSNAVASLTVDVNGLATGGTLHLPDPEGGNATVATREYVFPVGGTAGRTSYEQNGRMYIDTDLGQPIWYVTGTGWVDATGTGV